MSGVTVLFSEANPFTKVLSFLKYIQKQARKQQNSCAHSGENHDIILGDPRWTSTTEYDHSCFHPSGHEAIQHILLIFKAVKK